MASRALLRAPFGAFGRRCASSSGPLPLPPEPGRAHYKGQNVYEVAASTDTFFIKTPARASTAILGGRMSTRADMFHWTLTRVKFKPDPVSPREDRLSGEAWGVLTWKGVPRPEERVRSADKREWRTVEEANAKALEAGVDLSAQVAELQAQAAGKTWTRVKVVSTLKKSRRLEWRLTEGDAATAA